MSLHQGGILLKCVFHYFLSTNSAPSSGKRGKCHCPSRGSAQSSRNPDMREWESWRPGLTWGGVTPLIHSTMNPFDHTPGSASALGCILCMSPGPALRASRQWDLKNKQLLAQRELDRRERQETFLVEDSVDTVKDRSKMRGVDLTPEPTGGCVERD